MHITDYFQFIFSMLPPDFSNQPTNSSSVGFSISSSCVSNFSIVGSLERSIAIVVVSVDCLFSVSQVGMFLVIELSSSSRQILE